VQNGARWLCPTVRWGLSAGGAAGQRTAGRGTVYWFSCYGAADVAEAAAAPPSLGRESKQGVVLFPLRRDRRWRSRRGAAAGSDARDLEELAEERLKVQIRELILNG